MSSILQQSDSEKKILAFIEEKTKVVFPDFVQSPVQKAFYMAKTGWAIRDKSFFNLINGAENPNEFFKSPYSDKADIDVNAVDEEGNTLLHYLAPDYHFVSFSDYLIKKGATPERLNKNGEPPLKFNAHRLNGYCFSLIEKTNKHLLNKVYADGETILTTFFQKGSTCHLFDVAYWLIKQGADINLMNKKGQTPLYFLFNRIKECEKETKGYENLKYAIKELFLLGARSLNIKKICSAGKIKKNKTNLQERDFFR